MKETQIHPNAVLPNVIQSIGISCVPRAGMPDGCPAWMARVPVAAAVVTLRQREDGQIEIDAQTMSDARAQEFPLPWLLEQALDPQALTLIAGEDRALLQLAATHRRFFCEPRLVNMLADPVRTVDPCSTIEGFAPPTLKALAKYLDVPIIDNGPASNARLWDRKCVAPIVERALGTAVTQTMIGCMLSAFQHSEPTLFFPQMLALRTWLDTRPEGSELCRWVLSRPIMRAVSFQNEHRADEARRARGEPRAWPQFRDGLFHT